MKQTDTAPRKKGADAAAAAAAPAPRLGAAPRDTAEIGGPAGPEPTRYGDWERRGRCIDF
jgi:hypothetical protein